LHQNTAAGRKKLSGSTPPFPEKKSMIEWPFFVHKYEGKFPASNFRKYATISEIYEKADKVTLNLWPATTDRIISCQSSTLNSAPAAMI
jgi:hypothetical protein